MKDLIAARRYAAALFEVAGKGPDAGRETEAELIALSFALKASPRLEKLLANPQVKPEEKSRIIGSLYKDDKASVMANFLNLLFEKGRFDLIHEIAVSFKETADKAQNEGMAEIRSAAPLDAASEKAIVARLEKKLGQKLLFKTLVDPALLGGVSVKVGHKIYDGSVKTRIENLKKELTQIRTV